MTTTTTARRRREIAFLACELFHQARGVLNAVGDLVPVELAAGAGELEAIRRWGQWPSGSMTR